VSPLFKPLKILWTINYTFFLYFSIVKKPVLKQLEGIIFNCNIVSLSNY